MATAGKLQEDFLTCSVCMEVFVQPVTLACQHTFCKNCLGKYLQTKEEAVRNKTIPCPTCRQETPVPHPDRTVEDWAGQLKPGLLLTGLMDTVVQGHDQCWVCKEEGETTPATHWCSECEACYCDRCLKQHSRIPISKKHQVVPVMDEKSRQKKLICKKHDKKMKLYCRDCDKPLCTVCCSIDHRTCKEVVTIKAYLTEIKSKLQESQQSLVEKAELTNSEIKKLDVQKSTLLSDRNKLEADIRKIMKEAIASLIQKETQLVEKVKTQTEQDKDELESMMKTKQMDLQLYQQQSQTIQLALELEDEAQLFEMYLSSGSEAGADVIGTQTKEKIDIPQLIFTLHPNTLMKEIEMVDVKIEHNDIVDLTTTPVLDEVVDAKLDVTDSCSISDGLVMKIGGTKIIIFADNDNQCLKSFYSKARQQCSSVLKVSGRPWCMTVISEGEIAVSLCDSSCIIRVAVTPNLELMCCNTDK